MSRPAPVVLVPGFWLGAWAWDEVAGLLAAEGLDVTAITLPGLASVDEDRAGVALDDHVDAIVAALATASAPAVLVLHSGAGVPGYAATDRVPERVAAVVYVDSAPATGAIDPDFADVELPLPSWEELEADGSSIEGLSAAQLTRFRDHAVPEPGAALREAPTLVDARRCDVPSVMLCTALPGATLRAAIGHGHGWLGGLEELRDVRWVDLPTGHWPMWSRPDEVAALISEVARSR